MSRDRTRVIRTQVAIVGAGPAGLTLAALLAHGGVESVVLESHTREYVEARVRAGVLEQATVEVLEQAGAGDRLRREGIVHDGNPPAVRGRAPPRGVERAGRRASHRRRAPTPRVRRPPRVAD